MTGRIVMTLLVRNEEDIIEANIEFHLAQGVDFIIATDNGSTDRTRDLLLRYARQGVLHLIDEPEDDYSQSKWVTRMARLAHQDFGADWVINNDADEFWWPRSGTLATVLRGASPAVGGLSAARSNFRPLADLAGAFYDSMVVRDTRSVNDLGRALSPKTCHRAMPDITVEQGNHEVYGASGPIDETEDIEIFHFPIRTYAQFEGKIQLGGAAYARNKVLHPLAGATWRALYQQYLAGQLPKAYVQALVTPADIQRGLQSGRFVQDTRLQAFLGRLHAQDGAFGLWR